MLAGGAGGGTPGTGTVCAHTPTAYSDANKDTAAANRRDAIKPAHPVQSLTRMAPPHTRRPNVRLRRWYDDVNKTAY